MEIFLSQFKILKKTNKIQYNRKKIQDTILKTKCQ